MFRPDHWGFDRLSGGLSLEKTDSTSLICHWLPVALDLQVTLWHLPCSHRHASWGCHYVGLVQVTTLFRFHECWYSVTDTMHYLAVTVLVLRPLQSVGPLVHDVCWILDADAVMWVHQLGLSTLWPVVLCIWQVVCFGNSLHLLKKEEAFWMKDENYSHLWVKDRHLEWC